jgi:hypothetical protein
MGPEVLVELRQSDGGRCHVRATDEGTPDRLPHAFVGVRASQKVAVAEAMTWALGWCRAALPRLHDG